MAEELCHLPDELEALGVRELRVRAHVERERVDHHQTHAPAGPAWRIVRVPLCPCDTSETRRPSFTSDRTWCGSASVDRMTKTINSGVCSPSSDLCSPSFYARRRFEWYHRGPLTPKGSQITRWPLVACGP